ncbi:ParB N-terminal domain-containing protein [Lysinibacillus xylanilyticus]|uniref:ParB/RepB/Spo0J family partition protein n=1 Tax=Lysinibacillus xylanilyticus TaxID=582475 RepID=UPI003D04DA9F
MNEVAVFQYEQLDATTADFLRKKELNMREIVGKAYTALGKELKEAQDTLSKNGYGCFEAWCEYVGMKPPQVRRLIHRYSTIRTLCSEQAEMLEDLPVTLAYEVTSPSAESTPAKAQAKEEVLDGKIDTLKAYRERIAELESQAKQATESAEQDQVKVGRIAKFLAEYWGVKQGKKGQNVPIKTITEIADFIGEGERTTKRLLKLNELIPQLQRLVSTGKLGTTSAEQLAYLTPEVQSALYDALGEEIDELGLINPITVSKDFELLAGERRLRAHQHLGRTHIEANIVDAGDEENRLLIEIKENESREGFTFSERMDYARRLERIEREKAKQRMVDGAKGVKNLPQAKTREVVAEQVGFGSGKQYDKAKYIEANATDEVIEKLDTGEMSVHAAWKETKARLEQQLTDAETRAQQAEQRLLDAERSEEILTRQNERLTDELASVTKPETVVVEKEVERIVEVDKTDYSAVKRLQAYEKRFGTLENYKTADCGTNIAYRKRLDA